jgi:ribosomal protein L37AE/L43A
VSEGSTRAAQPYLCPFCGEEDLRPMDAQGTPVWHCRSCLRLFSVAFHGLAPRAASTLSTTSPAHDWSVDER